MKKLTFIIDVAFISFCAFLLAFAITQYFLDKAVALSISLTLTLITGVITARVMQVKRAKRFNNDELNKAQAKTLMQLKFLSPSTVNNLFIKAFKNKNILAEKRKSYVYLPEKNLLLLNHFSFSPLTFKEVITFYNAMPSSSVGYIFCESLSDELTNIISKFNGRILIRNFITAYNILSEGSALPQNDLPIELEPLTRKLNFKLLLNKKHARKFFFFGAYFIIFSMFSLLKIYYLICGCIFLIFAIFVRLFGYKDTAKSDF